MRFSPKLNNIYSVQVNSSMTICGQFIEQNNWMSQRLYCKTSYPISRRENLLESLQQVS